jgi:hypothetical protein
MLCLYTVLTNIAVTVHVSKDLLHKWLYHLEGLEVKHMD